MTFGTFIARSLRFYWRTHLAVLAGVAVTTAILTGSLLVGDSVRFTLRQLALARLGRTEFALATGDRFFRAKLADEIGAVPVLQVRGSVSVPDRHVRANDVQVVGVDDRFWQTNVAGVAVNRRLAGQLGLSAGDSLVLRVEQPSLISRDAPLSGKADATAAVRLRVEVVVGDENGGRFSLQVNQVPPLTVFLPLSMLQRELKLPGKANVLLATNDVSEALRRSWTLADAGLVFSNGQLSTSRVFLDPSIKVAGAGVLTYFANEIRLGDKVTPYSFVTAFGAVGKPRPTEVGVGRAVPSPPLVSEGARDDQITINSWLADDLCAKVGDELTLRYYVIGERRELHEESAKFRVSHIVPVEKDESWTPAFPGLADVDNCREWEPGIPIALERIRPKDEAYWKEYRGTPKAFISLATGQKLWANRFGNLTAIRFATEGEAPAEPQLAGRLALQVPAFVPVREQALRAVEQSQDFGQLFIGFSLFLIVAALLLTGMLFVFSLEQRRAEIGLLRALGFGPRLVRRVVLAEGGVLALLGAIVGVVAGVGYTKLTLLGLATVWRDAVGATAFQLHVDPVTLALGAGLSVLVAVVAMWLAQRQQTRRAPVELLAATGGGTMIPSSARYHRIGFGIGAAGCVGAVGLLLAAGREANAGAFFGAGACLLMAGIGFSDWLLRRLENGSNFGLRNATRRRGRSLTTVAVLASGVFLLVAVNAFHQAPRQDAPGTGGFAWYAQTALPVYAGIPGAVSMRVREGDDASCLNLNRAQQPRLLGVKPSELAMRGAFGGNWELLDQSGDCLPAIGDEATVRWALGKNLGDTLPFTDGQGRTFQLRIVGVLPSSILQGSLVIAEKNFITKFPSLAGYRVFLLNTLPEGLAESLADKGFEAVPAWRRLAEFMEVENTYLAIFQALGGLGLVLGSVGLAIVVVRNVLERRGELALLQAVGFERRALRWLVVSEYWLLVALGIGVGLLAAVVAVWPTAGARVPVVTLVALAAGGLGWSWLAAWLALRGRLLPALRNE